MQHLFYYWQNIQVDLDSPSGCKLRILHTLVETTVMDDTRSKLSRNDRLSPATTSAKPGKPLSLFVKTTVKRRSQQVCIPKNMLFAKSGPFILLKYKSLRVLGASSYVI